MILNMFKLIIASKGSSKSLFPPEKREPCLNISFPTSFQGQEAEIAHKPSAPPVAHGAQPCDRIWNGRYEATLKGKTLLGGVNNGKHNKKKKNN